MYVQFTSCVTGNYSITSRVFILLSQIFSWTIIVWNCASTSLNSAALKLPIKRNLPSIMGYICLSFFTLQQKNILLICLSFSCFNKEIFFKLWMWLLVAKRSWLVVLRLNSKDISSILYEITQNDDNNQLSVKYVSIVSNVKILGINIQKD